MARPLRERIGDWVGWVGVGVMIVLGVAILIWSWSSVFSQHEKWHDRQHADGQDER